MPGWDPMVNLWIHPSEGVINVGLDYSCEAPTQWQVAGFSSHIAREGGDY